MRGLGGGARRQTFWGKLLSSAPSHDHHDDAHLLVRLPLRRRSLSASRSRKSCRRAATASSAWTCTRPRAGSCRPCTTARSSCGTSRRGPWSSPLTFATSPCARPRCAEGRRALLQRGGGGLVAPSRAGCSQRAHSPPRHRPSPSAPAVEENSSRAGKAAEAAGAPPRDRRFAATFVGRGGRGAFLPPPHTAARFSLALRAARGGCRAGRGRGAVAASAPSP